MKLVPEIRQTVVTVLLLMLGACAFGSGGVPSAVPPVSDARIMRSLFLLGDAGAPARQEEPVLAALEKQLAQAGDRALVVFLGDNVYEDGVPDSTSPGFNEARRRVQAQVNVLLRTGVQGFFVPGNHDWHRDGWSAVRREAALVSEVSAGRVGFHPADGCPGPDVVDVGSQIRLVALDTEWWLYDGPKPEDPVSSCSSDSEREILDSLTVALESAGSRKVIAMAHHPLHSGGPHGGKFGWKEHIFPLRKISRWLWIPLPVVGSIYPLARSWGVAGQDLSASRYAHMINAMDSVFALKPPLIYAAGHEHNLQLITGNGPRYEIISGAGYYRHTSPAYGTEGTMFARSASGFFRLDILDDDRMRLGVFTVDRAGVATEVYSIWIEGE